MHLRKLSVRNFRVIEDIEVEFNSLVNVVVGPNAVGKATILEAIKLAKAMLAPRTQSEAHQSLLALNAASPHNAQQMIPSATAHNKEIPIKIKCIYELDKKEVEYLELHAEKISVSLALSRVAPGVSAVPSATIFSSPNGKAALEQSTHDVALSLQKLKITSKNLVLDISIDPTSDLVQTDNPIDVALFQFIENNKPPYSTGFNYFPADRALPRGEQHIQFGIQDAHLQLESYNSQPQLKYSRLKKLIFGAIISSEEDRLSIQKDFASIFSGILRGREISNSSIGVNEHGQLTIIVTDVETGRKFDIDALSSGEKGILLTFLTISRSMESGGIVLLDEPELHLNSAVCKDMLSFIVDEYAAPKSLQFIICSHSPEILAGAFARDECALFHLVSGTNLTKVRSQDDREITDALRRLGTSESEGLLYQGTLFVEGDDDADLLELGFGSLLRKHKIKDLGGRKEVEKQIRQLQAAEARGEKLTKRFFIFDRDEAPTNLVDTETVKVLQWGKRCLENYLIDVDLVTDVLKDEEITKTPVSNIGEVSRILRQLAFDQIDELAAKEVFNTFDFINFDLRKSDFLNKQLRDVLESLGERMSVVQAKLAEREIDAWKTEFLVRHHARKVEIESEWEDKWKDNCDGKRLFNDLHKKMSMKISMDRLKRRIMKDMKAEQVDNWKLMKSLLSDLIVIRN
ncbi:ATP-dependent endonuclease [uncultured Methylobacterium sp.]|uniref:ATP-dependent nuclease n=1 Tax=uncultured Methylobacterium sp. TaxID=157278 RepID=UPI0035CC7A13